MGRAESVIRTLEVPIYSSSLTYFFESLVVDPTSVVGDRTLFLFQDDMITEGDLSKLTDEARIIYLTMGSLQLKLEGSARTATGSPNTSSRQGALS